MRPCSSASSIQKYFIQELKTYFDGRNGRNGRKRNLVMRAINVGTGENKKLTLNSMSAPKDYNLSRSQFAKELGITRENLKQRMRRGQYKDHYIFENGQYKFTLDEAVRVNKEMSIGKFVPSKKKVRRGNHYQGKYPNKAFEEHNLRKMLAKVNETDPGFISEYHKLKELHKQETQRKLQKQLNDTQYKTYGKLNPQGRFITWETSWKPLEAPEKNEYDKYLEDVLGETPGAPRVKKYY